MKLDNLRDINIRFQVNINRMFPTDAREDMEDSELEGIIGVELIKIIFRLEHKLKEKINNTYSNDDIIKIVKELDENHKVRQS